MVRPRHVARSALLVICLIAAPVAVICYALPQTETAAWAWWRLTAATFLLQPVNALLLGIAGRVFFSGQIGWGLSPVSLFIGPLIAIASATKLLATHFPAKGVNPNELPDKPTVL